MPSFQSILLALGVTCTALAAPAASCFKTISATPFVLDQNNYFEGASCLSSGFEFIRSDSSPGCDPNFTVCFLDSALSTGLVSTSAGSCGFVAGTESLTCSASTAPAVFSFQKPTPEALPGIYTLSVNNVAFSVTSLDDSVLYSANPSNSDLVIFIEMTDDAIFN